MEIILIIFAFTAVFFGGYAVGSLVEAHSHAKTISQFDKFLKSYNL